MTISTTLNAIRQHGPCREGWEKLLRHLGKTAPDDEPLPLLTVLDSNGLDDTLWCLRALGQEHDAWVRLLVCDLVEPALQYAADTRPAAALAVARRYARGEATDGEQSAASAAAWAAASAARAAAEVAAGAAAGAAARADQERILRAALST